MTQKYYKRETLMPVEEDISHEFKAHTNLCVEEIPPGSWLPNTGRRSRAPVSRCLNGFLNTGLGGTVFLGVTDTGLIRGIHLTQYMKDHIMASLTDLMERYTPPVERHRYKVKFVPVVDANLSEEEIDKVISTVASDNANAERRKQPHQLRHYTYCWCHKDAVAQTNNGMHPQDYIIEIMMKKWNPVDTRNETAIGHMRAHPIHQDELNKSYFRGHAALTQYSVQEIHQSAVTEAQEFYASRIQDIKSELKDLRAQLLECNK